MLPNEKLVLLQGKALNRKLGLWNEFSDEIVN
jgi:hypothetical protein